MATRTCRKASGEACTAPLIPGKTHCRWHSPDPADQQRHRAESRRGGLAKAYNAVPSVAPLAQTAGVLELDLESAAGLKSFIGHTLRKLAELPFDVRVANAIAQCVTCARAVVEASDLEERLAMLEQQQPSGLKRA